MTTCAWLGMDMAKLGLLGQVPTASARLERQISARECSVELINRDGCFDESRELSLLHGSAWRGSPIDVRDEHGGIVSGRVLDGVADHSYIRLDVRSHFAGMFGSSLDIAAVGQDPATVLIRLFESVGVPGYAIDLAGFERAASYYQALGIRVSAICNRQYEATLLDAVNAVLDMACLYAWMDERLHVTLLPGLTANEVRYLQRIRHEDVLGGIAYGANTSERVSGYSLGYIGDADGARPAEDGFVMGQDAVPWTASYNATNQYQIVDAHSAHRLGALRMSQGTRRRTASIEVRDDGSIPLIMAGMYMIEDAPWGGHPAYLAGYDRASTLRLEFMEVV